MYESDSLAKFYARCWVHKYAEQPPAIAKDMEAFRFLSDNYTFDKAKEVIQTFFRMDDSRFTQDAHKPILIKWHARRILAELGRAKKNTSAPRRIAIETHCGLCGTAFTASVHTAAEEELLCLHCRRQS